MMTWTGSAIAVIVPSDMLREIPTALADIRVTGGADIRFHARDGRTRLADLREADGYKVRFPNAGGDAEAVIINTGGGVAGGDKINIAAAAGAGARATITTPSAERIYTALPGAETRVAVDLQIAANAQLNWVPQETILFNGARLNRRLIANMDDGSAVLISETFVFGRAAMGETVSSATCSDKWRIKRGGRLIFAENMKLDGDIARLLANPAIGGHSSVVSITFLAAPDAEARISAVRTALAAADCNADASAWNGMLVIRALASNSQLIRAMLTQIFPLLSGSSLPRVWSS